MLKVALAVVLLLVASSVIAEDHASGAGAFRLGAPILMVFNYDGGIDGWDGHINVSEENDSPLLTISNGCYFIVSKGRDASDGSLGGQGSFYHRWQRDIATHGELVEPIPGRVNAYIYNVSLRGRFSTTMDLAQFFDIEEVGFYTVYWGIDGLWMQEIDFEVIPVEAQLGTEDDL